MRLFRSAFTPLLFMGVLAAGAGHAQQGAEAQWPLATAAATAPSQINVSAELDNSNNRYVLGELINMSVVVDKPSYVTALNIAPDGRVIVLFPNQYNQDNYIAPGAVMRIPGPGAALRVSAPVGREIIKVIATENPLPLATITEFRQVGPFASSSPGSALLVARAIEVIQTASTSSAPESGSGMWGQTVVVLETSEARPAPAAHAAAPSPPPPTALTLSMSKDVYRVGEPIRFFVGSDRDCYLTLLGVAPSGQAAVLFPQDPAAPRRIPGGGWIAVPGSRSPIDLVAIRPTGRHTVAALCSTIDRPVVATAETLGAVRVAETRDGGVSQRALQVVYAAPTAPATAQARVSFMVYE